MSVSMRLLALSMIVAFAPMAQAGGLDAVSDEPPVIVADDDQGGAVAMGSLGNSGAVVGGVLALALLATVISSGSH